MLRAVRCVKCRERRAAYCPHRGVYLDLRGAPLAVVSDNELRARATAERVRTAFGKVSHRAGEASASVMR
jgi:hypothetical protein